MLKPNPDLKATLVIQRDTIGQFVAHGQEDASLGYRFTGSGAANGDGVWAEWHWDGRELRVCNDRFGFFPVYYCKLGSGIGVSTSAMDLIAAGADCELDDESISVFLRLGYYIGNDTPFKSIRLLSPGSELIWRGQEMEIRNHAPAIPHKVSCLSRAQAVREYGAGFQEVVESMLPDASERMCVPLSAGRDSRHILYALVRAGRRPDMVVTVRAAPPRPDTDAEIAAQLTKAMQLPHTILEQSNDRFEDELQKDRMTSFCADEHAQMVPAARWLNEQPYGFSWDGIAGDIFSCGVYNDDRMLTQFRQRQYGEMSNWLLAEEGYLTGCLTSEFQQRWHRDLAVKRLSRELDQYADLPNPAAPFFFYNRVRRELALCPFGMLNQKALILAPYLSHGIFDLLIDLPFEYFHGRLFHSEAIDGFYPELPQMEYVSTAVGFVPECRSRIWTFARRMATMALQNRATASCIRRSFLLPRLAKAMVNQRFGTEVPVMFSRILVMLHLEESLSATKS